MKKSRLPFLLGAVGVSCLGACAQVPDSARQPGGNSPNPTPGSATTPAPMPQIEPRIIHQDQRLGVPTFAWLSSKGAMPQGAKPGDVAREAVRGLMRASRMSEGALDVTRLRDLHQNPSGAYVAQFHQVVDGVEVFRSGLAVALSPRMEPVSASGFLAPTARPISKGFSLAPGAAIAAALRKAGAEVSAAQLRLTSAAAAAANPGAYEEYQLPAQMGELRPASTARARKVWFPQPSGLEAAYYVELDLSRGSEPDSRMTAYVISADSGAVLFEHDLTTSDSYSYRVWADKAAPFTPFDSAEGNNFTPHPSGTPDNKDPSLVMSNVVTLQNAPFSKNDPWLPAGAMDLSGNNVLAYADIVAPDGYNMGDIKVDPTGMNSFDRSYDPATKPQGSVDARKAITTQLFYTLNFMHDYFYDAGWNEASYNPQESNFGRGGMDKDPIKGEAQDLSGRNNANASTPADGRSPRIQMYLWDSGVGVELSVQSPMDLAGKVPFSRASFGPTTFNVSGDVVLAVDGTAPTSDACEALTNSAALAGKIALIDRGMCPFIDKVTKAQMAGAKGVLVANNAMGLPPNLGGTGNITIPSMGISQEDGDKIKAKLMAGATVTVTLAADPVDRDGSLDATIVSHEWGHILSNRLIGNAVGLANTQGRGMGEGWSDFVALLTIVRPEDIMVSSNAKWAGVYAVGAHALFSPFANAHYYGIRRYPYSTDKSKNPLTFKHIQNGEALPMMPAPRSGADGANNAEVHNSGEVWANTLWGCYAALLNATDRYTFAQANQKMREYLVASLKLTPPNPTMLEARDAVLAAMVAVEPKDYEACWQAFADRGMGVGAKGPDRASFDNKGVTESNAVGNDLEIVEVTLDDSGKSCDMDGVLDNGEVGKLTVKIRNTGTGSLKATTVTVTSSDPAVTTRGAATVTFPMIAPYATGSATVELAMNGAKDQQAFKLKLDFKDPNLAVPRAITSELNMEGNYDEAAETATTDTMDGKTTVWSAAGDSMLNTMQPFRRVFEGKDGRWVAPGNPTRSDQYLVSPPLKVADMGSFGFTVKHRYSFEFAGNQLADAGVIELSSDGGMTWTDIGDKLTMNGYDAAGVVIADNKPLAGRKAFGKKSTGYDMGTYLETKAELGDAYKGKTVQIRFRFASDEGTALPGWDINDVAFTGLSNKPFPSRQPNKAMCAMNQPPVADAGPEQTVAPGDTVTLAGKGTDPDNDPLTYRWTQVEGPMVMLSDGTMAGATFTAPAVQEKTAVVLQLVVNDGKVDSAPSTVRILVEPKIVVDPKPMPPGGCSCEVAGSSTKGASAAWAVGLSGLLLLGLRRRRRLS